MANERLVPLTLELGGDVQDAIGHAGLASQPGGHPVTVDEATDPALRLSLRRVPETTRRANSSSRDALEQSG